MATNRNKPGTVVYPLHIPKEWVERADKLADVISKDSVLGCLNLSRAKVLRMALAVGLDKLEATPVTPDRTALTRFGDGDEPGEGE